jgi:putative hydrolase of the HAD superfamily
VNPRAAPVEAFADSAGTARAVTPDKPADTVLAMPRTALIIDYAGVLTTSLTDAAAQWILADGLDPLRTRDFFQGLVDQYRTSEEGPVHGLEIGSWPPDRFEAHIAAELAATGLGTVPAEGLLFRMFGSFRVLPEMTEAVATLRAAGVRTALLSNSFGLDYDRADWPRLFDVTVISHEVRMRKPTPAIFELTCDQLGVRPTDAVFVDDLEPNVLAARALGMVGVHHVEAAVTLPRLSAAFGVPL